MTTESRHPPNEKIHTISIRVTLDVLARIDAYAAGLEGTMLQGRRSAAARRLIESALNEADRKRGRK
jgi:hypothetical protein